MGGKRRVMGASSFAGNLARQACSTLARGGERARRRHILWAATIAGARTMAEKVKIGRSESPRAPNDVLVMFHVKRARGDLLHGIEERPLSVLTLCGACVTTARLWVKETSRNRSGIERIWHDLSPNFAESAPNRCDFFTYFHAPPPRRKRHNRNERPRRSNGPGRRRISSQGGVDPH